MGAETTNDETPPRSSPEQVTENTEIPAEDRADGPEPPKPHTARPELAPVRDTPLADGGSGDKSRPHVRHELSPAPDTPPGQ